MRPVQQQLEKQLESANNNNSNTRLALARGADI